MRSKLIFTPLFILVLGSFVAGFSGSTLCLGHPETSKRKLKVRSLVRFELRSYPRSYHSKNYRTGLLHRLATVVQDPASSFRKAGEEVGQLTVVLEITKSGKPTSCEIEKSTANEETNNVLRALLLQNSYDALPDWFQKDTLRFRIKFAAYEQHSEKALVPSCP